MGGQSRQGGKAKPLKEGKREKKVDDEEDAEHKAKLLAAKKAEAALRAQLSGKGGPLNTGSQGIKKSGKK